MVSSSTNICPASTRWDSKISFRSSLPVWVASRDKTVHLCNDKPVMTHHTQSSTIKKLGLDDASTAHDLRNPPAVPCPSVKQWSQAETEVNCERIDTSCDTTATAWLWSLLFDSILVITEEAHPQKTFRASSLDFCTHRSMALTTSFKEYAQHHETKCVTFPQALQKMITIYYITMFAKWSLKVIEIKGWYLSISIVSFTPGVI